MSIAHAVAHGAFGRACLYELDRPMVPHAHREGHLIFHVRGPVASVVVDGKTLPLTTQSATAISPWQPHYFAPIDRREPTLTLVLYIRPGWFVDASHTAFEILRFGRWRLRRLFRRPAQCPHAGGLRSNLAVDQRG